MQTMRQVLSEDGRWIRVLNVKPLVDAIRRVLQLDAYRVVGRGELDGNVNDLETLLVVLIDADGLPDVRVFGATPPKSQVVGALHMAALKAATDG